jgi:hypothetical protein
MDFISIIKTVAPWIGTALGGPLGGMAVTAAANALGLGDKTTDAIKNAISGATPEHLLALKEADLNFALQMQSLGFMQIKDLEAIAAGDRDSARKMQMENKSFMPAVITSGILSSFIGMGIALFFIPIPDPNRDQIIFMLGQLSGFTGSAIAFWLGTTRQSEDKTRLLAQAPAK